ncbi:MAG: TiaS agmantine-binding domain-containing protein [Desulfurococcaceae archaeon]
MIKLNIGVDDVDTLSGGCTTHFAAILAYRLLQKNVVFADYLNLVRLNPAVPWKTRGNGAVALRLYLDSESKLEDLWEEATQTLSDYVEEFRDPKHQPVLAMTVGDVGQKLKWLGSKALHDMVPLDVALEVAESEKARFYAPKGGLRGLIGALAAIGNTMLDTDYTFELLAYRKREYWGAPRCVDFESVYEVDRAYRDQMILNYDPETGRVLITPHGPDPVLLGLRGEDPLVLLEAFKKLKICEPVEYIALFRTNQHTDAHLHRVESICDIRPYTCVIARGVVKSEPKRYIGGHTFFDLCDESCCITVAAYEPTKKFRNIIEKLKPGDVVEAYGCVRPPGPRHGMTLNLEKLRVLSVARVFTYENPRCPICGARMESMGRGKGYRCRKCGYRDPRASKIAVEIPRDIKPGFYQPPYSAFKHLMKPLERFGKEKKGFSGPIVAIVTKLY